jgi:hypothetical protein
VLPNLIKGLEHSLADKELIYKLISLFTPLLVRGKRNKPPHGITSIKETLIQVCTKRINHM